MGNQYINEKGELLMLKPIGINPNKLDYIGFPNSGGTTLNVQDPSKAWFYKVIVEEPIDITKIIIGVGAQSGNVDVGIYAENGQLLGHTGSTAVGGIGEQVLNLPETIELQTGIYWIAISCDNTTATFRSNGNCSYWLAPNDVRYKASLFPLANLSGPVASESWYDGRMLAIIAM